MKIKLEFTRFIEVDIFDETAIWNALRNGQVKEIFGPEDMRVTPVVSDSGDEN